MSTWKKILGYLPLDPVKSIRGDGRVFYGFIIGPYSLTPKFLEVAIVAIDGFDKTPCIFLFNPSDLKEWKPRKKKVPEVVKEWIEKRKR